MMRKRLRIKKKKPFFKKPIFWISIFLILILAGISYAIFFSNIFEIKKIEISGEERIKKEDFKKFLEDKIDAKNILLIKLDPIKNEILKNFPQISFVEIKRKFPSTLVFKITERKEVAAFCQKEDCYLIDKEGIVFEREGDQGILKIERENFESEIKPGNRVIEKEILDKILDISKKIEFGIEKVSILSEDNLHFKTSQGFEIFIDPQKDIDWQLTKLKVALENAIPKEKIGDLEYIDLRFGNFAYPKYKK
jgi:cell division septal protein FtsQ